MSGLEIERKFLVRRDGNFRERAASSSLIRQGYIAARGATVRIRIRDNQGFLTIKAPSMNGGMSRYEFEKPITLDEATHLMQLCERPLVEKRRYLVPMADGHTFEVDEFFGDNEGLLLAEVELKSEDEPYERPDFLGPEVTGNRHFYNSHLRRNPFSAWRGSVPAEYQTATPA